MLSVAATDSSLPSPVPATPPGSARDPDPVAATTGSDELTSCDVDEFVVAKNESQLLEKISLDEFVVAKNESQLLEKISFFDADTKHFLVKQGRRDTFWKAFMSIIVLGILAMLSFIVQGQIAAGDCPPPPVLAQDYQRSPLLPNMTKVSHSDRRLLLNDEEADMFDEYTAPKIEVDATLKLFESGVTSFLWAKQDGSFQHVNMESLRTDPDGLEVSAVPDGSTVSMTTLFLCSENVSDCTIMMVNPDFLDQDEEEDEDGEDDQDMEDEESLAPRRLLIESPGHRNGSKHFHLNLTEMQLTGPRRLWWGNLIAAADVFVNAVSLGWDMWQSSSRRRRRSSYRRRRRR